MYIRRDIGTGDQEDPDVDSLIQFEGESAAVRWNVGWFPAKAKAMVKEFILKNQKELEEMWEKEQYKKLPPLD